MNIVVKSLYISFIIKIIMTNHLFTSESVTEGHPDKVADNISDALLDAYLKEDPNSRVAIECLVKNNFLTIAGEVTSTAKVNIEKIARQTINEIGYNKEELGFNGNTCAILIHVTKQSPDIAQGVNENEGTYIEQGAGDQGLMFGFACNETKELMPLSIVYAHKLTAELTRLRKENILTFLRPDGKSQVTVEYENGKPKRIDTVVISTQHDDINIEILRKEISEHLIVPICKELMDNNTKVYVNPTGKFVIGGPVGDAGLTGRKIIVDTYGGHGSHGGGCFSGKDPSKVDRSASYMARYIAKNVVAAKLAEKCEIQLAYAIGVSKPVSIHISTHGTSAIPEEEILKLINKNFDLTPKGIIDSLNLKYTEYRPTAAYGHFGRKIFPWENTKKINLLDK